MKIGFIGMGIMGSRMAANLLKNDVELLIYNRSKDKLKSLEEQGAQISGSVTEMAKEVDILFTMLSTPEVVREISYGDAGFLHHLKEGSLWVDSSTVSPDDAKLNFKNATASGVKFLEAPVAGTRQPAEEGKLVFFIGGETENIQKASPYFEMMGQKHMHLGEAGSGASMKILINHQLAMSMLSFAQSMHLASKMGMNEDLAMTVLSNAPVTAPFIQNVTERLKNKSEEVNFPLQWMNKDLGLFIDTAKSLGAEYSFTKEGRSFFEKAMELGLAEKDFTWVYEVFENK